MAKVIVVTPTYNEKENVLKLLPDVVEALTQSGIEGHILVVDDNSSDGTGQIVQEIRSKNDRIHLMVRPGKMGIGSAYVDGFTYARSNLDPDIYIQMDADLSHPPAVLPRLIQAVLEGFDVAIASRYVKGGGSQGWPLSRRLISKGANRMAKNLLELTVKDVTSGYRALSRRAVDSILSFRFSSGGYSYQVESVLLFSRSNLKIVEVPFTFIERASGGSKLSKREVMKFAWTILRMWLKGDSYYFKLV